MKVSQAIAHAQEWINRHATAFSGFRAAHLVGGILSLPPDAPFPAYRDVEFNLICSGAGETTTHLASHQGLILEYTVVGADGYRTALHVLENPALAAHLARGGILADPHNVLTPIQPIVAALYGQRSWMEARCARQLQLLRQCRERLLQAATPQAALWPLVRVGVCTAALLAEATLRVPARRRDLIQQREILTQHGRLDLHKAVLDVLGWAAWRRHTVEWYASQCAAAFDYAVIVARPPALFHSRFQPAMRPRVVAATVEMIEQGHYQEAMLWISDVLWFSNAAIQRAAPLACRPFFQAIVDRLVADMGVRTPADLGRRAEVVAAVIQRVADTAEALMNQYCQTVPEDALWS